MAKKQIIIPVGEYGVSNDSRHDLVTVLGSCVAVTLYNRKTQTGGLIHVVLPGKRNQCRENDTNTFYADTGIELLINEMEKLNSKKPDLVANVIGGASPLQGFNENTIGQKNIAAAIQFLKRNNVPIQIIDTGCPFWCGTSKLRIAVTMDLGIFHFSNIFLARKR